MKNRWSLSLLIALFLNVLLCFSSLADTTIHFLDVGQGQAVLIESDGKYLLYDGGDSHKSSFVVAYLKQQGITKLDYVIASHYDSDHLNGIVGALNVFESKTIMGPDYEADSRVYRSFQAITESKKTVHPKIGQRYTLGSAKFQILAPSSASYDDVNNYSIAFRLVDGDTSFLFTGDAEAKSETEMLATGLTLSSDVLVIPHHGSNSSSTKAFVEAVAPDYAVLSCGQDNQHGHPAQNTMDLMKQQGLKLFRTDRQGTIIAETDGETITWNVKPTNDYSAGGGKTSQNNATQEKETQASSTQNKTTTVYWTPNGKKYHSTKTCSTLKNSKTIYSGTTSKAGDRDACKVCH